MKVIISGGGTGGHIFPAIAIADAIISKDPKADILFVGAKGKMEMERVPKSGYSIKALWISGFQRGKIIKNLLFPLKLLVSIFQAWYILLKFNPKAIIGVGGFASGPILKVAGWMKIDTYIQEQNSYAGVTNRILGARAKKIFVAYDGMDKFFDKDKIVFSGNPVREEIYNHNITMEEARATIGLDQNKKTILVFGGSLGAGTLNKAVSQCAVELRNHSDMQIIWQVGKLYYEDYKNHEIVKLPNVHMMPFIDDMRMAYCASDIIVCRAGALTISELALVSKPAILVPSPNVAEDHQTKNAMALVDKGAAMMLPDMEVESKFFETTLSLLNNEDKRKEMISNLAFFARKNAADVIADEIYKD
jgi:UDP-N-acetylglucosamine--N-acetylmuramyl-(pentapeptide) pyrophosphoryl-undecaprenol N-acetylglucosamine transferase